MSGVVQTGITVTGSKSGEADKSIDRVSFKNMSSYTSYKEVRS